MENLEFRSSAALERWLKRATCRLSADSTARVRAEIQEHYRSACEEASAARMDRAAVDRRAVAALGDARTANRQYRKVLLTVAEARLLREATWEAKAVCSRLSWFLLVPVAMLGLSAFFFARADRDLATTLLVAAAGFLMIAAAPFLPIYTAGRARIFRTVRWAWLASVILLAMWPNILKESWLLVSCAWPIIWVEWTLSAIRRKLPVERWPKQLYL